VLDQIGEVVPLDQFIGQQTTRDLLPRDEPAIDAKSDEAERAKAKWDQTELAKVEVIGYVVFPLEHFLTFHVRTGLVIGENTDRLPWVLARQ
jgi:hypothetical protein